MQKLASRDFRGIRAARRSCNPRSGPDTTITRITNAEQGGPGDLVFVGARKYIDMRRSRGRPAAIVTNCRTWLHRFHLPGGTPLSWSCNSVNLAQACICCRRYSGSGPLRHRLAAASTTPPSSMNPCDVPESAIVGPGVVLSRNVVMGERCVVMANSVIEQGCRIGAHTVVHPNVVIGHDCESRRTCDRDQVRHRHRHGRFRFRPGPPAAGATDCHRSAMS